MKKLTIFLLTSIMMIGVTFGQVVDFSGYHFDSIPGLTDIETSYGIFPVDDQKFGYGHIVVMSEAGKTYYIDEQQILHPGPTYLLEERAGELKTVGESILVSTIDGVFDLFTGQQLAWLSGYMNNDLNPLKIEYDPMSNKLFIAGSKINGLVVRDLESGITQLFEQASPDFDYDFGLQDIRLTPEGDLMITMGNIWIYHIEEGNLEVLPYSSLQFGKIFGPFSDGSMYVLDEDGPTYLRIMDQVSIGEYDMTVTDMMEDADGNLFITGNGLTGINDGIGMYQFVPDDGLYPVYTQNGPVSSIAKATYIGGEIVLFSSGIVTNVTGIEGFYGYPVVRLTDDEVVGIYDTPVLSFTIYPNPATEWVKIEGLDPMGPIWMTDETGRKHMTSLVSESIVDIGNLPAGVYFLNGQPLVIQK